MGAKFLCDGAWYFYLFWLPKYLYDARGFNVKEVAAFAWIPYAAAGVGCLSGGWFSSELVRRHVSVDIARKLAMGLSAALMPFVMFIPYIPVSWAIAIFSLAYFGHQSWSTLVMVLPTDLFPARVVGSVAGLIGSVVRWEALPWARSSATYSTMALATVSSSGSRAAFI